MATKSSRAFPTWSALIAVLACALPSAPAQTLSETFDDGVADNWSVVSGVQAWTIPADTDRVYSNIDYSDATACQISTYTGATWTTNFVLQARVKLWGTGTGNRVGLVYNYQAGSPVKYYAILLHKATSGAELQFIENTTGASNPASAQSHTYPVPSSGAPDNHWVTLRIARVGTLTTVTVTNSNGSATFTRTQTAISGAGHVGVIDRSADSAFNDVTVGEIRTPGITESFGSGPTYSPTRYVDSSAPNDNGAGTQGDPWKYAPGMPGANPAHVAAPGDVIALKCGSEWRLTSTWNIPTSGSSGSPIVFTAEGSGALPKITVLEDVSTGWTLHSGSVYKRTVTGLVERLYIDGVGLGEASSGVVDDTQNWVGQTRVVTTVSEPYPAVPGIQDGTPGPATVTDTGIMKYWRHHDTNADSAYDTLYLYSPDGDPDTLGNKIEALKSGISSAIRIFNKSHVYIDRLEVNGGTLAVVNIDANNANLSTDVRVTNCVVRCAQRTGIRVFGATTGSTGMSAGQIKWNVVDSGDGPTTRVTPDDAQYGRNPSGAAPDDLCAFSGDGQLGSSDGIALWNHVKDWVVAQNEVSNFWHTQLKVCVNNAGYGDAANNILEHNEAHADDINYAHGLEINSDPTASEALRLQGNIARFNHIYNTWVNSKHEGNDTKFYGNLIVGVYGSPRDPTGNNGWSGDGVSVSGHGGSSGGVFAYNTIVDAGGAGIALTSYSPPTGLLVANNIFSHSGNRRQTSSGGPRYSALRDQNSPSSPVEVVNNLLYSPHVTTVYEYRSGSSTLWDEVSQMQTVDTDWTGNIGADPEFTNYTSVDLTLGASSPARNAAKDISAVLPESTGWFHLGCWQLP